MDTQPQTRKTAAAHAYAAQAAQAEMWRKRMDEAGIPESARPRHLRR